MNISYAQEPVKAPHTRTPVKLVIILCCAIVASMWVYYFVFATNEGVYQVQDKSWRVAAHEVCAAASLEREALADTTGGYIANPTNEQMLQRADIVDQATNILDQMINIAKYNMERVNFSPDLIDAACATYFISAEQKNFGAKVRMD